MIEHPSRFAIVVIGGSAGSLSILQRILSELPHEFPAAIFVSTHIPPNSVSAMPHILSRSGPIFATHAIDGAPIAPGRIVVAQPNCHLVVEREYMHVVDWAKENGQRPSIDVLFRSAAGAYGDMVCAVLLSGTLDDGVAGLQTVRAAGGCTIVQDPDEAMFGDMPRNAIAADAVDVVATNDKIGTAIKSAVAHILENANGSPAGDAPDERVDGKPSVFTCPDCGGTLWELEDQNVLRFRCRTGHAYNVNSMLESQRSTLENSLTAAIRALLERNDLLRRLARRARDRGDMRTAERFAKQSEQVTHDIAVIQSTISEAAGITHSAAL